MPIGPAVRGDLAQQETYSASAALAAGGTASSALFTNVSASWGTAGILFARSVAGSASAVAQVSHTLYGRMDAYPMAALATSLVSIISQTLASSGIAAFAVSNTFSCLPILACQVSASNSNTDSAVNVTWLVGLYGAA